MSKELLSSNELDASYAQIQGHPFSLSESELAYYCNQSRLDPRLAEVVNEHIRDFWWKYDSEKLNTALLKTKWPFSILVMLEQIKTMCAGPIRLKDEFAVWCLSVCHRIAAPSHRQLYFIGTWLPGSKSLLRQLMESTESFSKFNFFGTDTLFNKQNAKSIGDLHGKSVGWRNSARVALCKQIIKAKKERNLSGRDLAKLLHTDATSISNILGAKIETFSVDFLAEKVEELGLKPLT